MKMYGCEVMDDDHVYPLSDILAFIKDECIPMTEVVEQVRMIGERKYYCTEISEDVESTADWCGSQNCEHCAPCNGKSGKCRHLKHLYKDSKRKFTLYQDGRLLPCEKVPKADCGGM